MGNSINKFTTYKRIDRFVLSPILDPNSSDLEVTCRLYYPLQTRTIAETYKLSVLQKSVNISFKSGKGYIIEGTITLHFQSRNRGTEVVIFGNVGYGIGDDLQYQEGVISRYDTVRGSLSDEDIIFPDVSDLELSPLDTERNDTPSTNESGPMSDEYPTNESDDEDFEEGYSEECCDDNEKIQPPIGDNYDALFPYMRLRHWSSIKANDYPNDFIQYQPLSYASSSNEDDKVNNVFFELLKKGIEKRKEEDFDKSAHVQYIKDICDYFLEHQTIYWSTTETSEVENYSLQVTSDESLSDSKENKAKLYQNIDEIEKPFCYYPEIYDNLLEDLHLPKLDLSQYLKNILPITEAELKQRPLKNILLETIQHLNTDTKWIIDNIWQNYFLMVASQALDINFAIQLNKIIIVNHIIQQWAAFYKLDGSESEEAIPVHYEHILQSTILLPKTAFKKVSSPKDDKKTSNWITPFAIGQLEMVKYKFVKHEAGEIAHIENVIKGEVKTITRRKLVNHQTTTQSSNEERQTLDKEIKREINDLATEVKKTLEGVEEIVDYNDVVEDYSSPPLAKLSGKISKTVSGKPKDYAQKGQHSFAKKILQSTIDRISETVAVQRTQGTISENEETYNSIFDNKNGEKNIVGIYRWLNKKYNVYIENLGHRILLESKIYEPAQHFKEAQFKLNGISLEKKFSPQQLGIHNFLDVKTENEPLYDTLSKEEQERVKEVFQLEQEKEGEAQNDINYIHFLTYYEASKIETPPEENIYVAEVLGGGETIKKVLIPKNYTANRAIISYTELGDEKVQVIVGNQVCTLENGKSEIIVEFKNGGNTTGINGELVLAIPNKYHSGNADVKKEKTFEVVIVIQVECNIDKKALDNWRIKTFARINEAFSNWEKVYYENQTRLVKGNEGTNPLLFRNIERSELKRLCKRLLLLFHSPSETTEQAIDAFQVPYNQYFNRSLEWTDMTYSFDDTPTDFSFQLQGRNDSLRPFLQAHYANLFLPVQPDHGLHLLFFLGDGNIWKLPLPFVPAFEADMGLYFLYKKTIREKTLKAKEESWTITLPTTMQIVQDQDILHQDLIKTN